MPGDETALVVVVPEAEPVVEALRATLDPAAGWGVPAHVTVLYPFLPPDRLDDVTLAAVADVLGGFAAFDVSFSRVAWFDETVVWLDPHPAGPFRQLTAAVWRRFPETPPYGGAHVNSVPHLTIGTRAPRQALEEAAATAAASLPIHARVTAVQLLAGHEGRGGWRPVQEFPLATNASRAGRDSLP